MNLGKGHKNLMHNSVHVCMGTCGCMYVCTCVYMCVCFSMCQYVHVCVCAKGLAAVLPSCCHCCPLQISLLRLPHAFSKQVFGVMETQSQPYNHPPCVILRWQTQTRPKTSQSPLKVFMLFKFPCSSFCLLLLQLNAYFSFKAKLHVPSPGSLAFLAAYTPEG